MKCDRTDRQTNNNSDLKMLTVFIKLCVALALIEVFQSFGALVSSKGKDFNVPIQNYTELHKAWASTYASLAITLTYI